MSDTHLTPEQLEAQIEAQRAQLADTVDALAHKLDVKAQAKARWQRTSPLTLVAFVGAALVTGGLVWWWKQR